MSVAGANGYSEQIRQIERRMDGSEEDRRQIWQQLSAGQKDIGVLGERIQNLAGDVKELTEAIEKTRGEFLAELRATKRSMWAAAIGSFGVVVAIATLIVTSQ